MRAEILAVMKADTDKPHRCPECWRIPDIIWDDHHSARLFYTYTCQNGHRFARWRRWFTWEELGLGRLRRWWLIGRHY